MHWRKTIHVFVLVCIALSLMISGSAAAVVQPPTQDGPTGRYAQKVEKSKEKKAKRVTQKQRDNAAAKAYQKGKLNPLMGEVTWENSKGKTKVGVVGLDGAAGVADLATAAAPHYFSHPNYANSPLPDVVATPGAETNYGNPLSARAFPSDTAGNVLVALKQFPLPDGFLMGFKVYGQAAGQFHAYVLRPSPRFADQYTVLFDSGLLSVTASGGEGTFAVNKLAVKAGDIVAWYGTGIPFDATGSDWIAYPANVLPLQGDVVALPSTSFPLCTQCGGRTYSFAASVAGADQLTISGGIKKFVDSMPDLGPAGANNLGQYLQVAVPDSTAPYAGSDYYEIAVVQFREQMHSDLPPTLLRGYVQLAGKKPAGGSCPPATFELFNENLDPAIPAASTGYCGVDNPHYLGATIVASKDKPVRILFRNLLPTGSGGNLFIPTDVTVMGAGMGPSMWGMVEPPEAQTHPTCEQDPKPAGCFTENRAVLHLHGGRTVWISDGTPHQWITPWGEQPVLDDDGTSKGNKGDSVAYVPDMWYDASGATICAGQTSCGVDGATNNPGDGAQTYYYTNAQSARLLFYHDHAWGITRLNVYAGEAAGYVITDQMEADLVTAGVIPAPTAPETKYLVIQDKTFVPSAAQLAVSDETWDGYDPATNPTGRWGGLGNLWLPHVYSPAQNPGVTSGVNEFGRWAYGPWFWPPTQNIVYDPLPNPYYDPTCNPNAGWCEPPLMPGTPFNSMGMEAFHDTPLVNGTAYPALTVDPKAYRFRILNAASDRFFNLSIYKAVDANGNPCDPSNPTPAPESTGIACTEVALNPAEVAAALADPTVFPTPLPGTEGPDWIQFGTEGGFLPAPVLIPAQPTTWVNDPTVFNAGNVDQHSLLLGPAERADAIVDFSAFAGQTLILYNDAPAAFPARDPRYDYYTGNGDYRGTGGAPSTLRGYGPNTRTVMQIKVNAGTPAAYDLAALETKFKAESLGGLGVFKNGQDPIIVGQAGGDTCVPGDPAASGSYNSAYGTEFQCSGPDAGVAQIYDFSLAFKTLANGPAGLSMTMGFQTKAIQDEMGEAFDHDYGRMSGNLGLEVPLVPGTAQNLVLYPYVNPVSELFDMTNLPKTNVAVTPITSASDGTQIWKITHNGVDTHPIHFHLYDVQLLNRVGWDGIIRKPDANELGWKDTVRISPLEDTIVAIRPVLPVAPFDLPNSVRRFNPAQPLGSTLQFNNQDAQANPTAAITNEVVNFGWEYVWHCHILSHEEMDMMRPQVAAVPPIAPDTLLAVAPPVALNGVPTVNLTWVDKSKNESGFLIQRGPAVTGPWTDVATVGADVAAYTDTGPTAGVTNYYQVIAVNTVGYTGPAAQPGAYSSMTVSSAPAVTQVDVPFAAPAAPTGLTATYQFDENLGPRINLAWTDNATNETNFVVQRCAGAGCMNFATIATPGPLAGTGAVTFLDATVATNTTYRYQVAAANGASLSVFAGPVSATVPNLPAAPTNATVSCRVAGAFARCTVVWVDAIDETGYTVQRSRNSNFVGGGLATANLGANTTQWAPLTNLPRATNHYFRIRSVRGGLTSVWVNAVPFPIRTP